MSDDITFPFVPPLDPWELARELTPPSMASPGWLAFVAACLKPMCLASAEAAETARQVADPNQATGSRLDQIGTWVGQARDGLPEHEFRRIVVGALSARYAAERWTWSRALAMWLALTGAAEDEVTVRTLGPACVSVWARLKWTPTDGYVSRAGGIIASAVPDGIEWEASMVTDGWLVLGGTPGLDSGLLSWYIAGAGGVA
jgi:hypothetical protein